MKASKSPEPVIEGQDFVSGLPEIDKMKVNNILEVWQLKRNNNHPAYKQLSKWDYVNADNHKAKLARE